MEVEVGEKGARGIKIHKGHVTQALDSKLRHVNVILLAARSQQL